MICLAVCIRVSSISFQSFLERKDRERPRAVRQPQPETLFVCGTQWEPCVRVLCGSQGTCVSFGKCWWPTANHLQGQQAAKPSTNESSLCLERKRVIRADQRPYVIIRSTLFCSCQGSHPPRWRKVTRNWFRPAPDASQGVELVFFLCYGANVSLPAVCSSYTSFQTNLQCLVIWCCSQSPELSLLAGGVLSVLSFVIRSQGGPA